MGILLIGILLLLFILFDTLPKKAYWKYHDLSIKILIEYLVDNFNNDNLLLLMFSILAVLIGILRILGKM